VTAVLGVDQSLRGTGLAMRSFGETTTALVRADIGEGVLGIREAVRFIVGRVVKFAPACDVYVLEAPIIPRHGSGLALERAWLFGMLFDQLMLRGRVATVHPSTRALYATGNGRASKEEVVAAIAAVHPHLDVRDDNVADALALMGMGCRWLGSPVDGEISSKQAKAMRSAHWPTSEGVRTHA
jgi:hypothetical protein